MNISALLPCRNGAKFLPDLIPSILRMLDTHDELLIIEDGSTDQSLRILRDFSNSDNRVKVIETGGVGLVKSLNLGVDAARNSWIARFDVDDEYSISRLAEQKMKIGDDVDLIFSDYEIISESGSSLGKIYSAIYPGAVALSLFSSQRTPHSSVLMRRYSVIEAGGYDSNEFPAEDLGLWLRMIRRGTCISVSRTLLRYRLSKKSVSYLNNPQQKQMRINLVENFGEWNYYLKLAMSNFNTTLSLYKKESHASSRIILHLIDIIRLHLFLQKKIPLMFLLLNIKHFLSIRIALSSISISWFKFIRILYKLL